MQRATRRALVDPERFNPHPVRRPGATRLGRPWWGDGDVSILTRSADRVQRRSRPTGRPGVQGFNPHPVRRPGATSQTRPSASTSKVSILTRSADRVQPEAHEVAGRTVEFQSSPGPQTGCNHSRPSSTTLTWRFNPHPVRRPGATTKSMRGPTDVREFQSSPGPQTGCNIAPMRVPSKASMFQSSPGPQTGCNEGHRTVGQLVGRFNPHPVRRPGATARLEEISRGHRVSILTRSADRVQQASEHRRLDPPGVSILTRSADRVQPATLHQRLCALKFQSSPGPQTGCNVRELPVASPVYTFQSSPGPQTGCNGGAQSHARRDGDVSILTRSADRVQRPTCCC